MNFKASNPPNPLPNIAGYDIGEPLYLGTRTAVYRAMQTAVQRPVVIKVLRNEYPSFSELVQFRNQYTIARNLPIPGIVQPLSLEPLESGYALVMEDWGGVALGEYLQQQSLGLTEVLTIALQLADILHALSQHQVVHKDIKPANILIHSESKQVKLIDFSIASLLPKETQEIQSPNVLEGTLAYLAPEQTGRMNRGIDYRADFYALGVTLYQLLSGTLPFTSEDLLELVNCHIAKQPTPVNQVNQAVPEMVAAIVAKLMAKNAEDRYQSATGLKHDLQQCLTQWNETGTITAFELGQRDVSDRFLIPEKLYGRETEVQTLLDAFDRVTAGQSELILVAGFSGIGKTAIVNEVHKPITRQNGYFIKGKFDQFNRNIPLSAFVQALRDLMGQLLSENDTQLQTWKTWILDAVGDNGQVVIEVIPELEQIIGAQPPATELSGTAAQNRFNLLFQKFIQVFTTPAHPLVMFLDDLQWADAASLNLIQVLMAESTTGYLLLIGAYRDNEVFAAHPLMLTLDTLRKARTTVNTITLSPLGLADVNQLIADTLHCAEPLAQPLTELVMQKTQGNPFFATQFLKTLHQEKLITFDAAVGYWQCDIVQVRDAALTDDVVEFMALQLRKLPEATQTVLKLAACIGAQFDLSTLAIVSQQSETEVATALWKALQEGLILPQSDIYKFYVGEINTTPNLSPETLSYRFLHDRVQQAAYSLIPDDQKQVTHLDIGTLLLEKLSISEREEQVFEIVNHLNMGRALMTQPLQREELARLNLVAGCKAKASTAYAGAFSYITVGMELLRNDCWQQHYELMLNFHKERVEVEYLNGNFTTAEIWIERTLENARTPLEKAEIYNMAIVQYTLQAKYPEAIQAGHQALLLINIELPEENFDEVRDAELAIAKEILDNRSFASLAQLPLMVQPEKKMAIKLLISMGPPTYRSHQRLWSVICAKAVNLCLQSGNTPEIGYIYPAFGGLRGYALNNYQGTKELLDVTIELMQAFNNKSAQSVAYLMIGSSLRHWSHPLKVATEDYLFSYKVGLESSNLQYAAYAFGHNMYCRFYQSLYLEKLLAEINDSLAFSHKYKNQWAIDLMVGGRTIVLQLLDDRENSTQISEAFAESDYLEQCHRHKNWQVICIYNILKTQLLFLLERPEEALEYGRKADAEIINVAPQGLLPYARHIFIYLLLLISQSPKSAEQLDDRHKIATYQKQLEIWAKNCPENFRHLDYLVKAEIARTSGKILEAIDLYDRAIAGAKANEYFQEEALANELAAKFYLDWGKEKVAAGYMQEAYYCYARWGAKAKINDLESRYPQLLRPILQSAAQPLTVLDSLASIAAPNLSIHSSSQPSRSSSTSINTAFDFAAILKVSQSLAGTIQLDELLHQLTQIILQNSGGDRCALILPNEAGEWMVRAIATPDETQLCADPLTDNPDLPVKLIQYVKNTQEVVVIDNLETDLPVIDDDLRQHQPKSLLCLPILNQGHLIGILYLKNHFTSGVFTSDRLLVLNFLCTQAAISLENGKLYTQLRESTNQLQNLANNLPGVIYQFKVDEQGQASFLFMSDRSLEIFEVSAEETCENAGRVMNQIDSSDMPSFQIALQTSMQQLQPFQWTGRFNMPSGQQKWVEATSIPVQQPDGSVLWDGVMLDVSDRKQAERYLMVQFLITQLLADVDSLAIAIPQLLQMFCTNLGWCLGELWLIDPNTQTLKLNQTWHIDSPELAEFSKCSQDSEFAHGFDLPGQAWAKSTAVWKTDVCQDSQFLRRDLAQQCDLHTAVGFPIQNAQTIQGVLILFTYQMLQSNEGFLEMLTSIGSQIGQFIDRITAEAQIRQKNQDLETTLEALQKAQLQTVQSEKMASLGNLVAGVAHEINNPIGFLNGSINNAKEYVQDFLGYLALYQQHYPNPATSIQDYAKDIDLEFLSEDLPKLLNAMKGATDRIKSISTSLRTFSRADTEHKVSANLHNGLDSTLLILKYRLKANQHRPEIQVLQQYGELPHIQCFPGQLNQVFMNILANAIDVFDEIAQQSTFADLQAIPQTITIQTVRTEHNTVEIRICDNGKGMSEAIKSRIFDHLFTTKGVGKGTGLGLTIARQIVVENHKGTIEVHSRQENGTSFLIKLPIT
jgi:predicted ATPase/signal transduction histidine kinase